MKKFKSLFVTLLMVLSVSGCFSDKEKKVEVKVQDLSITGTQYIETGSYTTFSAFEYLSDNTTKSAAGIWTCTGCGTIDKNSGVYYSDTTGNAIITLTAGANTRSFNATVIPKVPDELRGET